MSDNKYIIDKDSLTGIADAVRNKLGTGEATTDSQTGDIVYPEDKGYYLEEGKIAGFIYPDTSSSHWTYNELISVSHATILELCGGINPSFIKFTVLTTGDRHSSYNRPSRTLYNGVYFYSGEVVNDTAILKNIVGATKTFEYTGQGCYITGEEGYYSGDSYYSFPGVLQIEFLNENKQNIEAAIDGPIAGTSRYTMEIPNGEVPTKIPFSIDDIQDRITNYLQGNNGIGPIPTAAKAAVGYSAYFVQISSIFTSIQDFRNRFLQANVNQGTGNGFLYLISKKNGRPASMKELDIPLPSNIKSGVGGWDMAGVRLAYENNLTFPLCCVGQSGAPSLGHYWLYVSSNLNWIVFCSDNTVGQYPSNDGSIYIAYLN